MPFYTFLCENGHEEEVFRTMTEHHFKYRQCPHCEARSARIYKPPQIAVFRPYVTRHFTGEPIEVRTPAQESELCDKHRVYRMLDSEKVDKGALRRKREKNKHDALERNSWEECIARAEADHGQKLVTPDAKKKTTCKKRAVV